MTAISPSDLRRLATFCIEQHIDRDVLDATLRTEELERETLARVAESLGGNQ
ncbi:MAG TPA: hypothetical protein VGJ26_03860 [Pirellulales bacterium]